MSLRGLRRKPVRAAALLAAGAIALGAFAAPAAGAVASPAAPAAASADPAQIALEGTLVVAIVESEAATDTGTGKHDDIRLYAVRTESGATVELEGELPEGSKTGDDFAGTVEVPTEVLDELTATQADAITDAPTPVAADSAEAVAAQDKASELSVSLPVADAQVVPTAAAAGPNVSHSLYLALPTVSDGGAPYTASQATSVGNTVANYWRTQSEGTLEGFTVGGTRTYNSAYPCAADLWDRWDEAAAQFGDPTANMFFDGTGKHLVVMLPANCEDAAGIGVGTVGDSLDLGGVLQVVMGRNVDTTVLAHEIGHNLGLGHANLEYCGAQAASAGCTVYEYGDYYDVMGVSYSGYPALTSLNGASKVTLGFVNATTAPTVSLPTDQTTSTTDIALPSLSNLTGVQVIRVVDPSTGEVRFVEYRSGTGSDAGAVYTTRNGIIDDVDGGPFKFQNGVRILETNSDHETEALTRWVPAGSQRAHAESALPVGATIATADGGVSVTYLSGTSPATIRITLNRGAAPAGTPVYRFWSEKNKTHFYTISAAEKKAVEDGYSDYEWKYEFVAYLAYPTQAPGTVPLYRFFSNEYQGHFYTTSVIERDNVINNFDDNTWKYENIAYYVYPTSATNPGLNSVYRFWSNLNKHHFYTSSAAERDNVINNFSDDEWLYEWEIFKVPTS